MLPLIYYKLKYIFEMFYNKVYIYSVKPSLMILIISKLILLQFLGAKLSISLNSEPTLQMCYYKKVFWIYAENLQENIHSDLRF